MKKRKLKKSFKVIVILLIFTGLGFVGFKTYEYMFPNLEELSISSISTPTVEEKKLSLVMVGDALIHSAVYADAKTKSGYDFKPMFAEIKAITKDYDLKYYNQETILGGTSIGLSTYPRFNSPYEVGDAFMDMGFNLVSLSNNHTLDRGFEAIKNSRTYWDKQEGVLAVGSYTSDEERNKVIIKEKNGITYAMLAYTTTTNGLSTYGDDYLVNEYDEKIVKKDIEAVRDKVDLLMVAMHWGSEYTHEPTYEEKTIAKYLASLDVDIIIGSHPHVVQPIEYIDDTLVIYSLGNFVSAQLYTYQLTGLMASVDITKHEVDGVGTNLNLSNTTAELIYTCRAEVCGNYRVYPYSKLTNKILYNYKNEYKYYKNIVTSYDDTIKVVGID